MLFWKYAPVRVVGKIIAKLVGIASCNVKPKNSTKPGTKRIPPQIPKNEAAMPAITPKSTSISWLP